MTALLSRGIIGRHGLDATLSDGPAALVRVRAFHTFDALRGVAAIAVLMFHVAFIYGIGAPAEGQIAVDLFFVMSGFIIAYRYDSDLHYGLGVKAFAIVRSVRLYPLYLLGTVLGVLPAVVAVAAGDADTFYRGLIEALPFHLAMLPSRFVVPRIEELYPINYVAWSLALEMLVNLAYAATFRVWTIRRLALLVGLAFLGLCGCAFHFGTLNIGFAWPHAWGGLVRVLFGFPMGVLIYRLQARKPLNVRVPWWSLLLAAVAIFVFDAPWAKAAWEVFAVCVLVPLIVVAAAANEPPRVARGTCAMAGVFSYVLYSLHGPFVGLFLRGENRLNLGVDTTSPAKAAAFTLLLGLVCIVAHLGYDKPVRRWLSRRFVWRPKPDAGRLRAAVEN